LERGTFKLSPESEKILSTVRPDLQRVIRHAASITTVPFAIVSGNRTAHQQRLLYAKGRTTKGPKVTWTLKSNHMGGNAIDFSLVDARGKPTNTDPKTWKDAPKTYGAVAAVIKAAGKELGVPIYWGYDMWKKDFGHIQTVAQ
jgi:peptidoglycan L-alanyl-D-glutamate endopeptidase CwlK